MYNTIIELTGVMFCTQIVFIWFRTLNVRMVSSGDTWGAIWTGFFIHLSWLIGISIGTVSIVEMVKEGNWSYWPVIAASSFAGAIGTYFAMETKLRKQNLKNKKK